jgi:hypothetical protein
MKTTDYIEDIDFLTRVMDNWGKYEDNGDAKEHLYLTHEEVLTLKGTDHLPTKQALIFKAMYNKTKQELTIH